MKVASELGQLERCSVKNMQTSVPEIPSSYHLEELLPEITSKMFQVFRAETVLFPPSMLNFDCSQTRLTKTAGI